ncbi:MAG: ribosome assembly factor SBDS [Candidatus Altiarchaeota archaeon]|nr:ribosome assembly factor SBDS [Candidatus Altiarchaeota archaeon]
MVKVDDAIVVKMRKVGKDFQILADPKQLVKFRADPDSVPLHEIMPIQEIFKDARKGDRVSESDLEAVFETTNQDEIIRTILMKGDFSPTAEQRREMLAKIHRQVIDLVARNAIDPRTNLPHTPDRIESAMKEAKVHADLRPAEEQFEDVVKALLPFIPLKFGKVNLRIHLPMSHASRAYGKLRSIGTVKKEQWLADGLLLTLEVPSGMKVSTVDLVNQLTQGEAEITIKEE